MKRLNRQKDQKVLLNRTLWLISFLFEFSSSLFYFIFFFASFSSTISFILCMHTTQHFFLITHYSVFMSRSFVLLAYLPCCYFPAYFSRLEEDTHGNHVNIKWKTDDIWSAVLRKHWTFFIPRGQLTADKVKLIAFSRKYKFFSNIWLYNYI